MGDERFSPSSKVEEYVRRFGGVDNFFDKILSSFNFSFSIINVDNFEVDISNSDGFRRGIKCYELYNCEKNISGECPVSDVVRKKERVHVEDGDVDVFMVPIFGEGGRVVGVIKYDIKGREVIREVEVEKEVVREVVKEKVVEKMSKEHEESFYNILQNSRDVVYRYDFNKGAFEYVSESVYTLMGFPLSEFVSMKYDDFLARVHPDDIGGVCEVDYEKSEAICEGEYRWKCKDGKYRWFLDKRTWFFDDSGKRVCVVGDIKDIHLEKEKDYERSMLEEKIALIKKRENEASERTSLTEKEKIVLWGLCRFPLLNDDELSSKLDLKRSTLTAIKNRLKGKDWFSLKYIPNFAKLGCQFFGVFDGVVGGGRARKLNLDLLKNTSEVVLTNYQDEKFFGVFVSNKYVEFRKFVEKFENENKEALRLGFNENSFFYDLEDFELRDFSEIVNSLFSLGKKEKAAVYDFSGDVEELNVNERRVLHSMIKDPDISSSNIAKAIWVSKPTVIKIRNKLIEEDYVYTMIVPNFKKLGLGFLARLNYEIDSKISSGFKNYGDVSRTVLRIKGKKNIMKFVLFTSEEEYKQEVDLIREVNRQNGNYLRFDSDFFVLQKRGKNNFNLEPFVNDLLFRDDI